MLQNEIENAKTNTQIEKCKNKTTDKKAMRVGTHVDGWAWMLDEDGAIHRIDNIDIATQQQEGATMRKERVSIFEGLEIELCSIVVVVEFESKKEWN